MISGDGCFCVFKQEAQASGCFAFTAHTAEPGGNNPEVLNGVLTCVSTGLLKVEQYLSMMDLAKKGCGRIATFAQLSLQKAFQNRT